ncbi:GntR family transcriptional regulator [Paenibacillus arenilitoris]|uniref:GntR family transcriptional regulator n=1 Tax=Paenibacillus arenilitoris TaxID=2772299 RepID=A0A927H7D8_9BACL|nr:GntR family transcriptional regulator [Paenibacillus arenilitoris]MBD2870935.1 GntR family transcriptional regulator [Paenibacillus arenilitoris]
MNTAKTLDAKSPIPLYYQLKEILLAKIEEGEWKNGTLIPTENELIQHYQVSRTTVREAVNSLVAEGKLEKKQGRGTMVRKPKIEPVLGRLMGFTERISMLGFEPGARLIEARVVQSSETIKEKLQGEADVYFVKRVRLADDEPISIEETYWPLKIGKLYEGEDLNEIAFYPVLEKLGYKLSHAEEVISSVVASKEQAQQLNIKSGMPLLRIHRTTYTAAGEAIQYCCNYYRSDRYSYKVHLER